MSGEAPLDAAWAVGGATVVGASHIRRGAPNQDAIGWLDAEALGGSAVLVVSDGHGSPVHGRSDDGARIAVEAGLAVLSEALRSGGAGRPDPKRLGRAIVARWREGVRGHVGRHPLPPSARDIFVPYGATLVAAAVTPAGLLLIQLGDGDIVVGRADGSLLRPLPDDEGMIGQQTYSLCQDEAEARLRTALIGPGEPGVDFVMLSTDGLSKSFEEPGDFLALARQWRETVGEAGLASVTEHLADWLTAASRRGSGDDIALGFLVRAGAGAPSRTAVPFPGERAVAPGRGRRIGALASWALGLGAASALVTLIRRRRAGGKPPATAAPAGTSGPEREAPAPRLDKDTSG